MKILFVLFIGLACLAMACSSKKQTKPDGAQPAGPDAQPAIQQVSAANLGKRITVLGEPRNLKLGAQLAGEGFGLWIKGLDSWPDEVIPSGHTGKRLSVTGVLVEDHSLPVFVHKEGEPIKSGMPVPEGTDLKKASHRFLLDQVTWEPAE
jgi:hypothetical protein